MGVNGEERYLLPAGTSIIEAFDDAGQELLILGEPGVGKSTLLLELALQLIKRAENDEQFPLPVIVPLSSWAVKRLPLHNWLAETASQIYDIPQRLCQRWINEQQFLPLLDGLDEMNEATRPDCIAAINAYHRERMRKWLYWLARQMQSHNEPVLWIEQLQPDSFCSQPVLIRQGM